MCIVWCTMGGVGGSDTGVKVAIFWGFCVELLGYSVLLFLLAGMCSGGRMHKAKQT